jgi:hypothetical protein
VLQEFIVTFDIVRFDEDEPDIPVPLFVNTEFMTDAVVELSVRPVVLLVNLELAIDRLTGDVALIPLSAYSIFV